MSIVFPGLDFAAGPVVPLFTEMGIFCIAKEMFFTYLIAVLVSSTAEGVSAIMIVVDKVAFGPGKFEISAILTQDGKFSSAICRKASIIVSKSGLLVLFRKESLSNWI